MNTRTCECFFLNETFILNHLKPMRKLTVTLGILAANLCFAQNDTNLIQEVEVFGEKAPSQIFQGQHVQVIDHEQIERTAVKSINELLEFASAVDVRQRSPFDVQADVSVRGGTFDQTLVLLNGIPMNDPQTGHHNMNLPVQIQDIERIEILHGGGSHRYGPYAFSGAINIITKKPEETAVSVELEAGEYGYLSSAASVAYPITEQFSARVGANYATADGYLNNSDFNRATTFAELNYSGNNLFINGQIGYNEKGFGAQNFYTSAFPNQYEATSTLFGSVKGSYTEENAVINFSGYTRRHTDRFELYRETGEGWYQYDDAAGLYISGNDTAASWYQGPNFHKTNVAGGELSSVLNSNYGRTEIGFDIRNESILSNNLGVDLATPLEVPNTRFFYTKSDDRLNTGVFIHHKVSFDHWTINASLRYNMNSAFGPNWLPGVEVAYNLPTVGNIYASFNRSFRLPTFTDLYYRLGGAQGSIDLQPEFSNNYELGLKRTSGKIKSTVSLFIRDGENMIDWVVLPSDTTGTLRAQNITQLTIYGIDGDLRVNLAEETGNFIHEVRLSAAFMNSPTGEFDFESLYALDFLAAKASIGVSHKIGSGLQLSWQVNAQDRNGTYVDFSTGDITPYEPIALIDARLSWSNTHWMFYIDANNLLDKVYQDRGNVLQPGRWIRGGMRWTL